MLRNYFLLRPAYTCYIACVCLPSAVVKNGKVILVGQSENGICDRMLVQPFILELYSNTHREHVVVFYLFLENSTMTARI